MPHKADPITQLLYGEESALLVTKSIGNQSVTLHKNAVSALTELINALAAAGLATTLISHWRSFQHQAVIWNQKWAGERVTLDRQGNKLDLKQVPGSEKFTSICYWSAVPGTSRHHWGTDFDIFLKKPLKNGYQVQLTPQEFTDKSLCLELDHWLNQHLESFGFFRPYRTERGGVSIEPWHISYRNEAEGLLNKMEPDLVSKKLATRQVSGSATITANIDQYFQQYLLNIDQ